MEFSINDLSVIKILAQNAKDNEPSDTPEWARFDYDRIIEIANYKMYGGKE